MKILLAILVTVFLGPIIAVVAFLFGALLHVLLPIAAWCVGWCGYCALFGVFRDDTRDWYRSHQ